MFSVREFEEKINENHIRLYAYMIVQKNEVLALQKYSEKDCHNVYSIAKSFLSLAIGMAIDDGLLTLQDKPCDMFRDLISDNIDPKWEDITLEHLLTMSSGHGTPYLMAEDRKMLRSEESLIDQEMKEEWLKYAFSRPLDHEPGEKFVYGNQNPYIAGRMLEKVTGITVCDYLYEKLWEPLGIKKPRWDTDSAGHTFTASDLYLDIEAMTKLGQIYLGNGTYHGIRFVSEDWIKKSTSIHIKSSCLSPNGGAADELQGYGYYLWKNTKEGYRANGKMGQLILVLPEKEAVISVQARHISSQQILDIIWETIYPGL